MKITPWMLTIATFAVVCTLASGYFLKVVFARPEMRESARTTRTIPMLQSDVEPGTTITRAHLGLGPWDRSKSLEPDTILNSDTIVNRIAKEKISAATPLRGSMFYAPGDFPELEVEDGKRAVVVRVSPTTAALNAKLKPGQYVDVQLTVDEADVSAAARRRAGPAVACPAQGARRTGHRQRGDALDATDAHGSGGCARCAACTGRH